VPVVVTLLLGLFVGFLAGYLVGARDTNGNPGSTAAISSAPVESDRAAEGTPGAAPSRPRTEAGAAPRAADTSPSSRAPSPAAPPRPAARASAPAASSVRPQAPAAAARGRLLVRSTPSGAQVYVNGRRRGTTPLAMRDLAPGTYTLRVSREGFADSSRRVTVSASGARDVSVRLAARTPPRPATFTGTLYVDSRPRGARVLLDGKEIGTTPMQLGEVRAGAHVVRLELKDHRTWTSATRVVAGEIVRVTGSLERMP
jgi:hypothetical protein